MTDTEALLAIVSGYCQYYDDGRVDELVDLFTADASLRVNLLDASRAGRDDIRAFFAELVGAGHGGMHCAVNPLVEVDGDTATAAVDYFWLGVIDGAYRIGSAGRYNYRFVREPDRWRACALDIAVLVDPRTLQPTGSPGGVTGPSSPSS